MCRKIAITKLYPYLLPPFALRSVYLPNSSFFQQRRSFRFATSLSEHYLKFCCAWSTCANFIRQALLASIARPRLYLHLAYRPLLQLSNLSSKGQKNTTNLDSVNMTSLAVFPPLKKTITDLMDEELYQLPPQSPSHGAFDASNRQPGSLTSSPAMTSNAATATLSNLLNVPESFVEHYNRVNGSSNAVNSIPSLFLDNSTDYTSYNVDSANSKVNPFNTYANPDTLSGEQQQQSQQQQSQTQQQYSAFVRPELVLTRSMPGLTRRRITTLDDHESVGKQVKDEDYYLFNTDIQPSQLMANRNYFNTEDYLDNSLFIMNGDLDIPAKTDGFDSRPVPGFENDYLSLGDFAEDAEEVDDDSDDDNYFQDDNDDDIDDFDKYMMRDNDITTPVASTESFIPLGKVPSEGFMEILPLENNGESVDDDMMIDDEQDSTEAPNTCEFTTPMMHIPEEYHQSAAEITANNPNHQCELINPSTGRPCNKQFSRPYDLIRHQETIHASKKKIFRCVICEGRVNGGPGNGKSKTFSRGDALSRHIKVKHGLGGQEAVDLINEAKENVEFVLV